MKRFQQMILLVLLCISSTHCRRHGAGLENKPIEIPAPPAAVSHEAIAEGEQALDAPPGTDGNIADGRSKLSCGTDDSTLECEKQGRCSNGNPEKHGVQKIFFQVPL